MSSCFQLAQGLTRPRACLRCFPVFGIPVPQRLLSLLMLISVWDKSIRCTLSHHINQWFAASCLLPAGRQEMQLVSLKLGSRMLSYSCSENPDAYSLLRASAACENPFAPTCFKWVSTEISLISLLRSQMRCTVWLKEASWLPADLQVALAYKDPNKASLCSRPLLSLHESRAMK